MDHTALTVARLLVEEIIPRHGAPRVLLSDNGSEFRSRLLKEVAALVRTEQRHSSPYHPQCNGLTERANGSVVALLSLLVDSSQDDWDACLGMALFSHRSAVNVTMGVSPFRMLYGREAVLPLEAMAHRPRPDLPPRWQDVADYVEALQDDIIESHDLVREFLHNQQQLREATAAAPQHEARRFRPGERVWVYRYLRRKGLSPKLTARRWFGPYVVVRRLANSDMYEVRSPHGQAPVAGEPVLRYPWVQAIRLRPYRVRVADMPAPEPPSSPSSPEAAPRRAAALARIISANAGPNVGRAFCKGAWLYLRGIVWQRLFPFNMGVGPDDLAPAVVAHVDHAQQELHVLCPRLFTDPAASEPAIKQFLQAYSGANLRRWAAHMGALVEVAVDGDEIAVDAVVDAHAAPAAPQALTPVVCCNGPSAEHHHGGS